MGKPRWTSWAVSMACISHISLFVSLLLALLKICFPCWNDASKVLSHCAFLRTSAFICSWCWSFPFLHITDSTQFFGGSWLCQPSSFLLPYWTLRFVITLPLHEEKLRYYSSRASSSRASSSLHSGEQGWWGEPSRLAHFCRMREVCWQRLPLLPLRGFRSALHSIMQNIRTDKHMAGVLLAFAKAIFVLFIFSFIKGALLTYLSAI